MPGDPLPEWQQHYHKTGSTKKKWLQCVQRHTTADQDAESRGMTDASRISVTIEPNCPENKWGLMYNSSTDAVWEVDSVWGPLQHQHPHKHCFIILPIECTCILGVTDTQLCIADSAWSPIILANIFCWSHPPWAFQQDLYVIKLFYYYNMHYIFSTIMTIVWCTLTEKNQYSN
jgi:hypothetical protein